MSHVVWQCARVEARGVSCSVAVCACGGERCLM